VQNEEEDSDTNVNEDSDTNVNEEEQLLIVE